MNLASFWDWVDRRGPDDCWPWLGARTNDYGKVNIDGKTRYAHQVAFELNSGHAARLDNVCHKCDVRWCCNPRHLFDGTFRDNTKDAAVKLRLTHKLTTEQARRARNAKLGEFGKLAREFGVSVQAVSATAHGKNWKYLDEVCQ